MPSSYLLLIVGAVVACAGADDPSANLEATETMAGPLMRPGDNCLRCHSTTSDTGAPPWSAAGTVFPSETAEKWEGLAGVDVLLTDKDDKLVHLVSNAVGNFYTDEALRTPFTVALEYEGARIEMPMSPPAGACNACHSLPPVGDAPGRLFVP